MTLNQIEERLRAIAERHKQIQVVDFGEMSEFLANPASKYPVCFFQDSTGTIDLSARVLNVNYKIFLLDLVNVSSDAKTNEREVMSDMLEVAKDIVTLIDDPAFPEWKSDAAPFSFIKDEGADVVAGVAADISIGVLTVKDKCAIPKEGPFLFEDVFNKEMP